MSLFLRNARLVLDPSRGILPGWMLLRDGVIAAFGTGEGAFLPGVTVIDCGGDFLAPGLVDIHCHGAVGHDAMEASPAAFREILGHHASRGTTTAVLTTVAASPERIREVFRAVSQNDHETGCARLAGIHLEGPWFSPRRRGAHAEESLRLPEAPEIDSLMACREVIRRVTLAPELPGALEAIRLMTQAGMVASAGHSDATEEEALAGFAAGITQVTHLHNAMSSLRKTDPPRRGLAEAALVTPGILCELIADGVHVSPELLRTAYEARGWEHLVLVSDATAGAGLPEGSLFRLGELKCTVEGSAAWTGEGSTRCLAGSTEVLFNGIRTMAESCGVPLGEAVAMATIVPARALGMHGEIGSLEVGKRADLVRFSSDWEIKGVWIGGEGILPVIQ